MPRYQFTIEKRVLRRGIVEVTAEDQPSAEEKLREIEAAGGSLMSQRQDVRPLQHDTLDMEEWLFVEIEEVSE